MPHKVSLLVVVVGNVVEPFGAHFAAVLTAPLKPYHDYAFVVFGKGILQKFPLVGCSACDKNALGQQHC